MLSHTILAACCTAALVINPAQTISITDVLNRNELIYWAKQYDKNQDQTVTPDELKSNIPLPDANGNGRIELSELTQALAEGTFTLYPTPAQLLNWAVAHDQNKNGTLESSEVNWNADALKKLDGYQCSTKADHTYPQLLKGIPAGVCAIDGNIHIIEIMHAATDGKLSISQHLLFKED